MDSAIVLPGPETFVLFGVHVKTLSAILGQFGVLLGHCMAPRPPEAIGWRRQAAVIAAGLLVSLTITIASGQSPMLVLGWSIGIGFAGIAIFQIAGASAASATRTISSVALEEISARLAARKDRL